MAKTYDLNFRIKTDAKPTRDVLKMTAAEFRDFNRTVKSAKTPLDRFEKDLSDLNKAFQTGKIRSDQYQHALKRIESQYAKTQVKQNKFQTGLSKIKGGLGAISGAVASAAGSIYLMERAFSGVVDEMNRIDKIGKLSDAIGADTEFISRLDFIAQRVSGLNVGGADKALMKMTRRLAEAANGTGEAKVALELLGLEAKNLAGLKPEKQFEILSLAMDKVTDAGQRVTIATKLFDDEQAALHLVMGLTNDEMEKQVKLAERLGAVVTEQEKRKAAAFNDSKMAMEASSNAMKRAGSVFFSPMATKRMDLVTEVIAGETAGSSTGSGIELMLRNSPIGALIELASQRGASVSEVDGSANGRASLVDEEIKRLKEKSKIEKDALDKAIELNKQFNDNLAKQSINKSNEAARQLSRAFGQSFKNLSNVGDIGAKDSLIGKMLGRGLAAGINLIGKDQKTTFQAITADPAESIGAGTSEAFKIFNKQTSLQKVEKDTAKQTEKNTKSASDTLGAMFDFMQAAPGLGL